MTGKELHSGEDSKEQKQTGKMVRERQTRFQRISAITSDIAYSCHTRKDGGFSLDWITGAADRITGYSIEEIKAHGSFRFLVVEEDIPLFEKNVIGLAPGSRGSCELRIRHKNGNTVWISSFAECVAAAKIPGRLLYGGLTEITDRKQVEEKLSASEARYRRLFEAAKDGILILDADTGMIIDVNPFLTEMLGFSREEFLGKHIWDLGFFKGIVANQADFLKLQLREYIRYEDLPLETADGRRLNVEFVSNLYQVGAGRVIQCSIRGAHLASFPAQNPYPVVEVGTDGAVRFANAAAMATLARLGLDPDAREFLPGTPEELVLLRSQCERNPQTQELRIGKAFFLRVVAAPPTGDSLHVYALDITERKQAQDKLQVAQLQWSQFLEVSPDPMWIKDASGRYVAASKSYFHADPSAEVNIIGKTDAECFPPEKAAVYVADDRVAIDTGASEGEFTAVGVDGKLRNFLTKKVVLRAPDGSVAGTLGVSRDITDRKQAEEALLQARDDWESTFESLTDAVTIHDKNYDIIRANASARRMLGLPLLGNLITSAKCFMCFHGTEKPPEGCPSCRSLLTEQPSVSEFFEPHLNKYLEIRAIPRFDTHHQCIGLVHVVRDITERKRAEEALKESEDRFRAIFEQAAVGVALLNTKTGQYVRINQKYCDLVGYTMQEMLQKSFMDITLDQDIQENIDKNAQLIEGKGKEFSFEKRYVHKDGNLVWGNLTISPLWKSGDKPQTYFHIAIVENITERKQAEAQLRQSQKMGAIGQLAGGIAHDFNNLLTGILGNIALMRSTLPPADPLLENLNAAETAARQAADLTKGLLTFSRSATVLPVPMNITAAIDATLALLKQSLPATMEIVRDDEQTAWNVLVDQSQMTQILLNLAVNARDAMRGKGTLTIRARDETVDAAYVHEHPYARTGEFIHLSVSDTGSGMSAEVMQHLFEPFYTTKPVGSGTGLGLSIVYGAVKQAGGWITAVSTEGVGKNTPRIERTSSGEPTPLIGQTCSGATFDIYLPRCLEEPTESFTPSPLPLNTGSGTVLVVEDEPIVCAVAQALLSRSGYTVLTAPDGASALNVLRDHPMGIGLILLDMTMPGMTTGEVVQAIRALDPTVPILLNSGYTFNGVVKQMLAEDSVQGFLGKPYDLDQLLEKVQMLLHRG